MHYLDHAATTPVPRPVAERMCAVMTEDFGNPSSQYPLGRRAAALTAECRAVIAQALGCQADSLVFTSCGTESDNWAIQAALWHGRRTGKHIVTTAVEHSAVREPLRALAQQGYEVTFLRPDSRGNITAAQVLDALREDTVLVSVMLVNNETGCIFPVEEIARGMRARKSAALLHCDAVQGFLKVPCAPAAWGVDLMSLSAHKIGGPKGIGALYIDPSLRNLRPLMLGGGQERGLRPGTEATAQIAGFARAVELRRERLPEKLAHMAELKSSCLERLLTIPGMERVGDGEAPHILCMSLPGYPSANIITELGEQDICISAGSACHKGKASHVFTAMGLPTRTAAGAFRVSFGPETTEADIDALYEALKSHQANRFPML